MSGIEQSQENDDIACVKRYIDTRGVVTLQEIVEAKPGPTTDDELTQVGLTRWEQVRRIVNGLDAYGLVNYVTDEYIESEK